MSKIGDISVYEDCISHISGNVNEIGEKDASVYEICNDNKDYFDHNLDNPGIPTLKKISSTRINFQTSSDSGRTKIKYNSAISNPFEIKRNNSKGSRSNKILLQDFKEIKTGNIYYNNIIESEAINEVLEIRSSSIDFDGTNKIQVLLLGKYNNRI